MKYKVTVIVPVYNADAYLEKCIGSLLVQTIDSIEVVLIDDGSSDSSGEICDKYGEKYDNIKVLHIENSGPSKARNIGIKIARGEYIGFADADDYVIPTMYETLYTKAKQTQSDIVMCSYNIDNGTSMYRIGMNYLPEYCGNRAIVSGLLTRYYQREHTGLCSVCNKLFSKDMVYEYSLHFNEDLIRAEDAWFVFDSLRSANKVTFIDEPLYIYRQVPTSTMHTIQSDRYERSKAFRNKLFDVNNNLEIKIDNNEFYYEFIYEAVMYCRSMAQQGRIEEINKVLDDPFFKESCKYKKYLPLHLKTLCILERFNLKPVIRILLSFWKF